MSTLVPVATLHTTEKSIVYRAREADSQALSIVKIPRPRQQSPRDAVRLRREHELMASLPASSVVRVRGLVGLADGLALIMDDDGACSLRELAAGKALPLTVFPPAPRAS